MQTPLAQTAGLADPQTSMTGMDMAKQRLDATRQGVTYGSPLSKLVSSTRQLRKERMANRTQAQNLMSAIQDTTLPSKL